MAIVILQVDRSVVALSCLLYAVGVNSQFVALHATDPVAIYSHLVAIIATDLSVAIATPF